MDPEAVPQLLERVSRGDSSASDALFEIVYQDLHSRARALLAGNARHTLQPTALVHEAWLKLRGPADGARPEMTREHAGFLAVAATAMRSVLVDHARAKGAVKRGGGNRRVLLDEALELYAQNVPDVIELHEELERLAQLDSRRARIVELRFFGGLSIEETAEVLEISFATVERGWKAARAYLASRLDPDGPSASGP